MLKNSTFVKIRVVAPASHAEKIREALSASGAGTMGKYDSCSFSYPVTGRFRPQPGARPVIGKVGQLETVAEEVIEVICHRDKVAAVIATVKKAHPYEEPAIDIMPRFELQ